MINEPVEPCDNHGERICYQQVGPLSRDEEKTCNNHIHGSKPFGNHPIEFDNSYHKSADDDSTKHNCNDDIINIDTLLSVATTSGYGSTSTFENRKLVLDYYLRHSIDDTGDCGCCFADRDTLDSRNYLYNELNGILESVKYDSNSASIESSSSSSCTEQVNLPPDFNERKLFLDENNNNQVPQARGTTTTTQSRRLGGDIESKFHILRNLSPLSDYIEWTSCEEDEEEHATSGSEEGAPSETSNVLSGLLDAAEHSDLEQDRPYEIGAPQEPLGVNQAVQQSKSDLQTFIGDRRNNYIDCLDCYCCCSVGNHHLQRHRQQQQLRQFGGLHDGCKCCCRNSTTGRNCASSSGSVVSQAASCSLADRICHRRRRRRRRRQKVSTAESQTKAGAARSFTEADNVASYQQQQLSMQKARDLARVSSPSLSSLQYLPGKMDACGKLRRLFGGSGKGDSSPSSKSSLHNSKGPKGSSPSSSAPDSSIYSSSEKSAKQKQSAESEAPKKQPQNSQQQVPKTLTTILRPPSIALQTAQIETSDESLNLLLRSSESRVSSSSSIQNRPHRCTSELGYATSSHHFVTYHPSGASSSRDLSLPSSPRSSRRIRRVRSPRLMQSPVPFSSPATQSSQIEDGLRVCSIEHFEKHIVNIKETQEDAQKRLYKAWINYFCPNLIQRDLIEELRDGIKLIRLVGHLANDNRLLIKADRLSQDKRKYVDRLTVTPSSRLKHLANVSTAIDYIRQNLGIELVSNNPMDIVDGKPKAVLGLCWAIILNFQQDASSSSGCFPPASIESQQSILSADESCCQSNLSGFCCSETQSIHSEPLEPLVKQQPIISSEELNNGPIYEEQQREKIYVQETVASTIEPSKNQEIQPNHKETQPNHHRKTSHKSKKKNPKRNLSKSKTPAAIKYELTELFKLSSTPDCTSRLSSKEANEDCSKRSSELPLVTCKKGDIDGDDSGAGTGGGSLMRRVWQVLKKSYRASLPLNMVLLICLAGLCLVPLLQRDACCDDSKIIIPKYSISERPI